MVNVNVYGYDVQSIVPSDWAKLADKDEVDIVASRWNIKVLLLQFTHSVHHRSTYHIMVAFSNVSM